MKTNAMKTLSTGIFLAVLMFIGCKKAETGPAGPAGATGPQGPVLTLNNGGSISGNLTGTRRDGTPINETFNYTYYFPNSSGSGSGTLDSVSASMYFFQFSRSTSDIFSNNSANFYINTTSKTATTGTLNLNFTLEKSLSANKLFSFSAYTSTASATGLSYNPTTGLFTGNFSATIPGSGNNTNNTAIITGSFSANMTEVVYIIKQESGIKAD